MAVNMTYVEQQSTLVSQCRAKVGILIPFDVLEAQLMAFTSLLRAAVEEGKLKTMFAVNDGGGI